MAKTYKISSRKPLYGNKRSKALNATRRRWDVNLQNITIEVNGQKKQVKLSAKEIRTLKNKGILYI